MKSTDRVFVAGLRRALAKNGRALFEREFALEAECRRFEELYASLLEREGDRPRVSDAA